MQSVADISTAHGRTESGHWLQMAAAVCGALLGVVFLVSGGWKALDPFKAGELLEQAKVPAGFGTLGASALGAIELLAAFMLFHPRLRRWGKVLIFFYDPSCMHRDAAAKFMAKLNWGDTKIVSIPTLNPQWAGQFLHDTGLKAGTSLELDKLKKAFPFVDPPYGVALEDGHVKETFSQAQFNAPLPQPDLEKLGFVK